ncbi:STAS domain-containing protein [Micromonospora chalcea]|uniref:STAS domain-containing protein n=1 Tax=Micromonospora chalcea TaxID=1874 RepID=UPI0021A3A357|nr:STAS domain-containing protein [Micromonospora chalcea]MCT2276780.1 STAS domain-containing protein [Micromonospora chalcea]
MNTGDLWQWHLSTHPHHAILTLAGELDLTTSTHLEDLLATTLPSHPILTIDIAQVTFLDSTIISTLITAWRNAHTTGGNLTLQHPTGHVRRVLTITGVLDLLAPPDSATTTQAG